MKCYNTASMLEGTRDSWTPAVGRGCLLAHQGGSDPPAQSGRGRVKSHRILYNSPCWYHYRTLYPLVSLNQWLYYALSIQLHTPPHPQCCLVPLCCLCRIRGPAILWAAAAAKREAALPLGICSADWSPAAQTQGKWKQHLCTECTSVYRLTSHYTTLGRFLMCAAPRLLRVRPMKEILPRETGRWRLRSW